MNKVLEVLIVTISIIVSVISIVAFPFLGLGMVFGLAGSTGGFYFIMGIGYLGVIIFSVLSIFKKDRKNFFMFLLLSFCVLLIGYKLDSNFWDKENGDLCTKLRSNSTCVESATGFSCSDFNGMGFVTSKAVCDGKK